MSEVVAAIVFMLVVFFCGVALGFVTGTDHVISAVEKRGKWEQGFRRIVGRVESKEFPKEPQ